MRHLVFIKSQSLRTTPGRAQRAMGTPDHIAERLLGFEHAGVDLVLLQTVRPGGHAAQPPGV